MKTPAVASVVRSMRTNPSLARLPLLAGGMAALVASALAPAAMAATYTFTGGTDSNILTPSNYTPPGIPVAGDTIVFNQTPVAPTTTTLIGGAISLTSIQFDTAAVPAFTIGTAPGNGTFTLPDTGGSITMAATVAANQLINSNLLLGTTAGGTTTITNDSTTNSLAFAGSITSGAGGTAGVKILAVGGAGNVSFATVTKGSATSLTISKTGTGTATLGGAVDNSSLGLTLNGGTVVLSKASTGGVHALGSGSTITSGTLQLGGTGGDQIYDQTVITVNGGTFDLNGRSDAIGGLAAAASGGTVLNSAAATTSILTVGGGPSLAGSSQTFAGNIVNGAGTVGLTKNGAAPIVETLTGINTYSGATTINAGLIDFQRASALPAATVVTVAAAGGLGLGVGPSGFTTADLNTLFGSVTGTPVTLATTGTVVNMNSTSFVGIDPLAGSLAYAMPGASAHGLAKLGANTLVLATANNYSGGTSLYAGTISVGTNQSLGSGVISTFGSSTLLNTADLSGANKITNAVTLSGGSLTVAGASNIEFGGTFTGGSQTLTVTNSATTTLSGSTTAATVLNTLNLNGGAGSIFTIGAGGLSISNSGGTVINSTTGGTINGGQLTLSSSTATNGPDVITAANTTLTINSVIASSFGATGPFEGLAPANGTIVLNGVNVYGGATILNSAGVVSVGTIGNSGFASNAGAGSSFIFGGGQLRYTGAAQDTDRLLNFSGTTSGGTIDASGSGLLRFTSTAAIAVGAGSKTITLTGTGAGQINGVIQNNTVANTTAVSKTGTGLWNLSNTETYTGATTISGGTLALVGGGSLGATPVTVNSGGTFAVTPGVTGATTALGNALTLNAGSAFTMADGATSTATVTGNAVLAPAAGQATSLTFDLSGTPANDFLNITGMATVGAGKATIFLNGIGAATPAAGQTYTIITAAGGLTTPGNFQLGTNRVVIGNGAYAPTLSSTANSEIVTLGAFNPVFAYFTGDVNPATLNATIGGTNTNFSSDLAGLNELGQLPTALTDVFFSSTAGTVPNPTVTALGQDFTFNSLNFTSNAPATTINGPNTLTLAAGITSASANAATVNAPIILSAAQTFSNTGTGLLTIGGNLTAGPNALTFAGSGATTVVGGNFTTSSNVTVNSGAGAVTIASPIALGAASTFTNNSASLFSVNGPVTNGGFALTAGGSGNISVGGAIGGAGSLTKTGGGTLTLSAASSFTGGTSILGGTVVIGTNNALATGTNLTFGNSTNTVPSSLTGSLNLANFSQSLGALTVLSNSATPNTIAIGTGQTLTLTNGLTAGLNNASAATTSSLTVSGAGALNITGGSVQIGVGQSTPDAGNSSTGILDLGGLTGGLTATVTNFNVGQGPTSAGTVTLSNTANSITATTINVGNSATKNGAGSNLLTLGTGTNLIKADAINIGISKISGTVAFASQTAGSPGTVTITNAAGTGPASLTIGSNNGTSTGAVFTGLLDLRGHTATVTAGAVVLGSGNNTGAGSVTGTLNFDAGNFTANSLNLGSKAGGGGSGTATGNLNVSGGNFTVNAGGSFVLGTNTAVTGTGVGNVNITGGTLTSNVDITRGGGSNTSANLTLDGGTLDMANRSIGGANTVTALFQSGTLRNVAQINNGAGLTKTTPGTLILEGTNRYTGTTNINAGILQANAADAVGTSGALGNGGDITFGGGTLQYTAASSGTDYSGRIKNSASAIMVDTNNQTVTYASALAASNTGGLTKTGLGTLNLTAANAYSRPTTVNAGELSIATTGSITSDATVFNTGTLRNNGTITGTTTVNSGATLRGNGVFAGDIVINAGGTHRPGNSPGRTIQTTGNITLNGNLYIEAKGITANIFAIDSTTGTDPSSIVNRVMMHFNGDTPNNGYNPAGGPTAFDPAESPANSGQYQHSSLEIAGIYTRGATGTLQVDFINVFPVRLGDVFDLLDAGGGISGFTQVGFVNGMAAEYNFPVLGNGLFFNTTLLNSQGLLVVVPEPSRALLLLAGVSLLLGRRRRKG